MQKLVYILKILYFTFYDKLFGNSMNDEHLLFILLLFNNYYDIKQM